MIRLILFLKIFWIFFFNHLALAEEIAVSGYALEKIVKDIFPDQKVILLQSSKIDFHSFEPTPSQWNYLKKVELLVIVGTEPWAKKALALRKNKTTLTLSQNKSYFSDPHLWFNWELVEDLVKNLILYFKNKEPHKASFYEKRANFFLSQLKKLKFNYLSLKNCPIKEIFILGHPVFFYLLKDTGIKEIALFKGHMHEGEISLKNLAQMTNQLKKNKVKVIYLTDPEFERFKDFFNSQGIKVINVLSGDLPWEGNFITLLEKNLENFKIGLQCK